MVYLALVRFIASSFLLVHLIVGIVYLQRQERARVRLVLTIRTHTCPQKHSLTPRRVYWWLSLLDIPYVDTSTWEVVALLARYAFKVGVVPE